MSAFRTTPTCATRWHPKARQLHASARTAQAERCVPNATCQVLLCPSGASCVSEAGTLKCACLPGFQGNGQTCLDVDECAMQNGGCSSDAACMNTTGSRVCTCKEGFADTKGDGTECVDKCSLAGCDANATCSIVAGAAQCQCKAPYLGTGKACTFDQSCSQLDCAADATCEVSGQTRTCKCKPGYTGTGESCADINDVHGRSADLRRQRELRRLRRILQLHV